MIAPDIRLKGIVDGVEFSDRASELLAAICIFVADKGYPPTFQELMYLFGYKSIAPIQYHLERLRKRRVIAWTPRVARSIRVIAAVRLEYPEIEVA